MKILYFTATGNSLYVAKQFGGDLYSIPQMIKENKFEFSDDVIGIVFPIYSIKVPPYIEDFLKKAKFSCKYLFSIMTYGAFDGASPNHLLKIAEESGYTFDYINTIKMVDNWLPGFKMDQQIKSEHKKKIDIKLQIIIDDTKQSKKEIKKPLLVGKFATNYMLNDEKKPYEKKNFVGKMESRGIKTDAIVEDSCVQCGVCVKVCPKNNIVVNVDKPKITIGDNCISCYSCTHNCPTNSIRLKNERSKARFRNSNIQLQDIIKSNE